MSHCLPRRLVKYLNNALNPGNIHGIHSSFIRPVRNIRYSVVVPQTWNSTPSQTKEFLRAFASIAVKFLCNCYLEVSFLQKTLIHAASIELDHGQLARLVMDNKTIYMIFVKEKSCVNLPVIFLWKDSLR